MVVTSSSLELVRQLSWVASWSGIGLILMHNFWLGISESLSWDFGFCLTRALKSLLWMRCKVNG